MLQASIKKQMLLETFIKLNAITGTFSAGPDKSGETITGAISGSTAILDSYEIPSLKADDGT